MDTKIVSHSCSLMEGTMISAAQIQLLEALKNLKTSTDFKNQQGKVVMGVRGGVTAVDGVSDSSF